jgi:hypothetical protein
MEVPAGSTDDAVDSVGGGLELGIELGVGAAVELPTGGTAVSVGEADDVESEALCKTSPSEEEGIGERMSLTVLEHAWTASGTLPDSEHTPDTSFPNVTL